MERNKFQSKISRRGFLTGAAGAAVSLSVISKTIAQSTTKKYPKSDKLMRIGIVGGGFGSEFQWHEHPNCKVTAVCELRDDRMKTLMETYGCDKTYKAYSEMLKDENVDAVAVFTPAPVHAKMSVEAMEAGKHVISAVPAGINEEECAKLVETAKRTGKLYMMAETSFYRPEIISCRQWSAEGAFGEIFYSESHYYHDGLEPLWWDEDGNPTWRHGYPPMLYPTHCTGMIVPVTGERLTEVTCLGWGVEDEAIRGNVYGNPFYNATAFFKTSGGNAAKIAFYKKVASGGAERGQFMGTEMSFDMPRPGGVPAMISRRAEGQVIKNKYVESKISTEPYEQPKHWELLPEPLRHPTGHTGSHSFITNEFVMAVMEQRQPEINVYEALAYTIPGIYAHKSAMEEGRTFKIPDYGKA
jgi:predicted dehydrogenase